MRATLNHDGDNELESEFAELRSLPSVLILGLGSWPSPARDGYDQPPALTAKSAVSSGGRQSRLKTSVHILPILGLDLLVGQLRVRAG
jgi:hypothetical protein